MVIPDKTNGVTVQLLDDKGNVAQQFKGMLADFTTQPRLEPNYGSKDWIRQVWVTNKATLEDLKAVLKPGPDGLGTSGASAQVTICSDLFPDSQGTPTTKGPFYVIADGKFTEHGTRYIAHTLLVSKVKIDDGHPLNAMWRDHSRFLQVE